jgi:hypothetical protein
MARNGITPIQLAAMVLQSPTTAFGLPHRRSGDTATRFPQTISFHPTEERRDSTTTSALMKQMPRRGAAWNG